MPPTAVHLSLPSVAVISVYEWQCATVSPVPPAGAVQSPNSA